VRAFVDEHPEMQQATYKLRTQEGRVGSCGEPLSLTLPERMKAEGFQQV